MKLLLTAAALVSISAAARAEAIVVPFDDANPTATVSSYFGNVTITVSGSGQAAATELSDAFYVFTDESGVPTPPDDRGFYDLGFGTGGATASIDNFLSPIPNYDAAHIYTFTLNTGLTTPAPLDFSLVDDNYSDNVGSFTVSVTQGAVPEPASWALMLAGLGGLGAALRSTRRQRAVA